MSSLRFQITIQQQQQQQKENNIYLNEMFGLSEVLLMYLSYNEECYGVAFFFLLLLYNIITVTFTNNANNCPKYLFWFHSASSRFRTFDLSSNLLKLKLYQKRTFFSFSF